MIIVSFLPERSNATLLSVLRASEQASTTPTVAAGFALPYTHCSHRSKATGLNALVLKCFDQMSAKSAREEESGFIVAKLPDPTNKLAGAGCELYGHAALASIHAEGRQTACPTYSESSCTISALHKQRALSRANSVRGPQYHARNGLHSPIAGGRWR